MADTGVSRSVGRVEFVLGGESMGRLDGKVALITGGARGQGEAAARLFVAEGARVAITDLSDDDGKAVARSLGEAALYLHHDVSREDDWTRVVDTTKKTFGHIDVLLNNAGILVFIPLLETTLERYMRVIEVNQVGCFLGMRAVAPALEEAGGGSIINVSSTAGLSGAPNLTAYAASKFAVCGMTKVAAIELGPSRIRVNSLHPGGVATPMLGLERNVDEAPPGLQETFDRLPLGRIGTAAEMANLALFLASDESSYCTGSEFTADGGSLAGVGTARPKK
jgi:3alpha(or 20beta)-hydroxysteroid dehydrogenase